jgi:CheY-like chemotaxis protein
MPGGGVLTLRSRTFGPDRVQLEVTDTGVGMDEATRSRCLELFFTTKGTRGTGLGLAMVYGSVERHGGDMQIVSEPGVGTTVRLILPIASSHLSTAAPPEVLPAPHPSLHILVIDDDPVVLQSLLMILKLDGHIVHTADGGQSGIDEFRSAADGREPYQLVITDLGMPTVDGRTVAAAVKSIAPHTPVILLTGWGHRLLEDRQMPLHVDRIVAKPPKIGSLRSTIAELNNLRVSD